MLVLTLKPGDGFDMHVPGVGEVRVVITAFRYGGAAVGIAAPECIGISRFKGSSNEDERSHRSCTGQKHYPSWHGKAFSANNANLGAPQQVQNTEAAISIGGQMG